LQSHPDNGEARISLEALAAVASHAHTFEDLDFNFGERWIPAGVYSRYASWLFDTDVSVCYTASKRRVQHQGRHDLSTHHEPVFGAFGERIFNGIALMRHAIHNTTPNITKTVLDKTGKEMKIRDPESGKFWCEPSYLGRTKQLNLRLYMSAIFRLNSGDCSMSQSSTTPRPTSPRPYWTKRARK